MIPRFSLGEVGVHIPLAQPLTILDLRSTPSVREHHAAKLTRSLYIPSGADTPLLSCLLSIAKPQGHLACPGEILPTQAQRSLKRAGLATPSLGPAAPTVVVQTPCVFPRKKKNLNSPCHGCLQGVLLQNKPAQAATETFPLIWL